MSKRDIYELIKFVESQIIFTIESTSNINHYEQFLDSMGAKVLFNSTCMCLQSIGETIKQIDDRTDKQLFAQYPNTPWKRVIGLRHIISHEYSSLDPEVILETVKNRLTPLLADINKIIDDINNGKHDAIIN